MIVSLKILENLMINSFIIISRLNYYIPTTTLYFDMKQYN